jgi:Leucine-rich repeat (LRR) protein
MKEYHYDDLVDKTQIPDDCSIYRSNVNSTYQLPKLPSGLKELYCYKNMLEDLPDLPSGLTLLICRINYLSELPKLPDGLKSLDCERNKIVELPELPSGLTFLDCSKNPIKCITQENYNIMKKMYLEGLNLFIEFTYFIEISECLTHEEFFNLE